MMGWERWQPEELAIDRWIVRIGSVVLSLLLVLVIVGLSAVWR